MEILTPKKKTKLWNGAQPPWGKRPTGDLKRFGHQIGIYIHFQLLVDRNISQSGGSNLLHPDIQQQNGGRETLKWLHNQLLMSRDFHYIITTSKPSPMSKERESGWTQCGVKCFFWSQSAQTSQTLWKDIRRSNKHCMLPGSAEWHLPISILDEAAGTDYATGKSYSEEKKQNKQISLCHSSCFCLTILVNIGRLGNRDS